MPAQAAKTNGRSTHRRNSSVPRVEKHRVERCIDKSSGSGLRDVPERVARGITAMAGSTPAFLLAATAVIVWAALGPRFGYSETWQLVINTGTTIVTFLMVFLIQRTQNKESLAVQLKLDELVHAIKGASNRLVDVEDLSEDELEALRQHYQELANQAKREGSVSSSSNGQERRRRRA